MSWTRGIVAFACTGTLNKMYLKMYLSNCIFRICIFCVYRHIEQDIPAILPNYIIMKTKSVWELFLKIPPHCIDQILINAILINANGNNNISSESVKQTISVVISVFFALLCHDF